MIMRNKIWPTDSMQTKTRYHIAHMIGVLWVLRIINKRTHYMPLNTHKSADLVYHKYVKK